MVTIIYTEPHKDEKTPDGFWQIGWSKTTFEKCKSYIFHKGTKEEAQQKINSYTCKKYLKK